MDLEYKTTDMQLATVLSLYFPIEEIRNKNGRGTFVFANKEQLQSIIENYCNKQLSVEPMGLFDALKTIKNRLYNGVIKEEE